MSFMAEQMYFLFSFKRAGPGKVRELCWPLNVLLLQFRTTKRRLLQRLTVGRDSLTPNELSGSC